MSDNSPTRSIELYKKYRPQQWEDLIGQERVAKSLQTATVNNSHPTAYLFSGPRGCGKTSAAFLLAKSINCLDSKNGEPCNACSVCESIDSNTQLGVTYVSMANKGTTEDIRELVKQARLSQPVKQQVFILDEIHTIHKQAFDALLIPVEDKTMPALFVFCTTEIDRVPDTLKSRVRKRKFKLVEPQALTQLLSDISEKENLEAPPEAIAAAVKLSRGSVRQALSSLEELLSDQTEAQNVSLAERLFEAIAQRNVTEAIRVCAEANSLDVDFREFAEQSFEDCRDILLYCSKVDPALIGAAGFDEASMKKLGAALGGRVGLVNLMGEFGSAVSDISSGVDPRIRFELAVVKNVSTVAKMQKARAQQQES